jgi:hypothetical protein
MARGRKTIHVRAIVDMVNSFNAQSTCAPEVRRGWNHLVSDILHDTGNYNGFNYLTEAMMEVEAPPGVIHTPGGKPVFPDESRRFYFPPRG